jgi:hypothetical protein
MRKIWIGLILIAFSSGIAQQQMSVLYDPNVPSPKPKLAAAQASHIILESLLKAKPLLHDYCQEDFSRASVRNVARGSFTRLKSNQTVYAIAPCPYGGFTDSTNANIAVISIYEADTRIVSYAVNWFDVGVLVEMYSLKDIDQNGLSEIAFVTDYADGACSAKTIHLAEFSQAKLNGIGSVGQSLRCAEEAGPMGAHDYTIFVSKGTKPVFVGYEMKKKPTLALLNLEKSRLQLAEIR